MKCACGRERISGKRTCGRVECGSSTGNTQNLAEMEAVAKEFRILRTPFAVRPATERSQALQGLKLFGPLTTEGLADHFGVERAMLLALEEAGLVERKDHEGREWWRLAEKLLDERAYAKALHDETADQGSWRKKG